VATLWANVIDVAMGIIMLVSQRTEGRSYFVAPTAFDYGPLYLLASAVLNIILTLMIIIRLVLHRKNIRAAMGDSGGIGGLYKTITTMLVESSALHVVSLLLVVVLSVVGSDAAGIFFPILAETQVIAPLLIIQRIANQSALTSDAIVTGHVGSINFRSRRESIAGNDALPRFPMSPTNKYGKGLGEGVQVEVTIDLHLDKV